MEKAYISVGFTKSTLDAYRTTDFTKLVGGDIKAEDGMGNIIEVNVREGGIGYRITLNGKTLATGQAKEQG